MRIAVALLLLAATVEPALAHHPMGGQTPATLFEGLASGIGHPVIGFDHLAFIIGVGAMTALLGARPWAPLAFIAATLAGSLVQLAGIALPLAELAVAGSVVLLGAAIIAARPAPQAMTAFFALAGLFHGWAYGEAVIGAESTPIAAYLLGFGLIQAAIVLAVAEAVRRLWLAGEGRLANLRIAGGVIAGVGLAFLIENIEALAFPGM